MNSKNRVLRKIVDTCEIDIFLGVQASTHPSVVKPCRPHIWLTEAHRGKELNFQAVGEAALAANLITA